MFENFIRVTPDKEKAVSISKMVGVSLERIKETNKARYTSNIIKDYFDCLRELMSIIALLDGYKAYGEGSHKALIEYLESEYKEFTRGEIELFYDLSVKRNKISYDGFFITLEYLKAREKFIHLLINKLNKIIEEKLQT